MAGLGREKTYLSFQFSTDGTSQEMGSREQGRWAKTPTWGKKKKELKGGFKVRDSGGRARAPRAHAQRTNN